MTAPAHHKVKILGKIYSAGLTKLKSTQNTTFFFIFTGTCMQLAHADDIIT